MTPAVAKWLLPKVQEDIERDRSEVNDIRWRQVSFGKHYMTPRIDYLNQHIAELETIKADLEAEAGK